MGMLHNMSKISWVILKENMRSPGQYYLVTKLPPDHLSGCCYVACLREFSDCILADGFPIIQQRALYKSTSLSVKWYGMLGVRGKWFILHIHALQIGCNYVMTNFH